MWNCQYLSNSAFRMAVSQFGLILCSTGLSVERPPPQGSPPGQESLHTHCESNKVPTQPNKDKREHLSPQVVPWVLSDVSSRQTSPVSTELLFYGEMLTLTAHLKENETVLCPLEWEGCGGRKRAEIQSWLGDCRQTSWRRWQPCLGADAWKRWS